MTFFVPFSIEDILAGQDKEITLTQIEQFAGRIPENLNFIFIIKIIGL